MFSGSIFCILFLLDCFDFAYEYIFYYFNYYLPDFVTAICLGFIFGFSVLDICFNLTLCHNKSFVESLFLTRDQAMSLWSGSTDSKTLDYKRTDPREYQTVNSHKGNHLNKRPSITESPVALCVGHLI